MASDNNYCEPEGPIIDLLKKLASSNTKEMTILKNSKLIEILQKEFHIETTELHAFEVDVYISVFKKYLKTWPGWDHFDRNIIKIKTIKDKEVISKILTKEYVKFKEYFQNLFNLAQELAADKVIELKEKENSEKEQIVMEVEATRQQLNNLFYQSPIQKNIFNTSDAKNPCLSITRHTLKSIINLYGVETLIKLRVDDKYITYEHRNPHKLKHTLMALFMKQDFNPPVLSRKWIAIKLRPNMLLYSRDNIIYILESGLLFREDCAEVEQEIPVVVRQAGGWLTTGEQVTAAALVATCMVACPPRNLQRSTLLRTASYLLLPVCVRWVHRRQCRGRLPDLLSLMRDYLALARRAAALCREYTALHTKLESLSSVIEATHVMLCRQQSGLSVLLARASSAVLGNAPWLRDDLAWDAVTNRDNDNLLKIHHAFLVVQSTLLKHIAMVHFIPPTHARKMYKNHNPIHARKMCKNHNELIYWIHKTLIEYLINEFRENYSSLERMYRLLKNYGVKDEPKTGRVVKDSWMYSDVHTDIARASLELKLALTKCNSIDMFLDACAMNKQELNVVILNKDIEDLIDNITKCLATTQNSQIRLKKMHRKLDDHNPIVDSNVINDEEENILKIEDKEPETKDEVFYFVKTEDDSITQAAEDVTTGPGKKEKETSKFVLNELKRKLVKREDVMRERERQALAKTMPELKVVPEFPRQIKLEEVLDRKENKFEHHLGEPINNNSQENFKVSKKDLELSSSESESDFDQIGRGEILKDIRRHRVNKKNTTIDTADESLRPIEYSLGTGLAMASVLQINSFENRLNMAEEEFIGDGEVSDDSGNDD
ncbi:hypothetical protein RR48_02163 [Papilio machaon]|uniref:Uncharacterized protein n=1 Tax=Papilio machaon TaxID=76193 RepID=A0A0N1PGQ4_PAPMA|nr:hypothetical protein RR48_02163 [Papilio machaon]